MPRLLTILLFLVLVARALSQDSLLVKIQQALSCDPILIGFNEIGSFHEYWQDFHITRRSPVLLSVSWENGRGNKQQYDLKQRDLDKFVEQLVAFMTVEYSSVSSTFTVIYVRSSAGQFEYDYNGVDRGRRSPPAKLIRTLGCNTRLQHR